MCFEHRLLIDTSPKQYICTVVEIKEHASRLSSVSRTEVTRIHSQPTLQTISKNAHVLLQRVRIQFMFSISQSFLQVSNSYYVLILVSTAIAWWGL